MPSTVELSIWIGVAGWGWFIPSKFVMIGSASCVLWKMVPTSASAANAMNFLRMIDSVKMAPFIFEVSFYLFDPRKNKPPDLLLTFVSDRYYSSLWMGRTISLALYLSLPFGWVAQYNNNCLYVCRVIIVTLVCLTMMVPRATSSMVFTDFPNNMNFPMTFWMKLFFSFASGSPCGPSFAGCCFAP